jgi:hypothetical protein
LELLPLEGSKGLVAPGCSVSGLWRCCTHIKILLYLPLKKYRNLGQLS